MEITEKLNIFQKSALEVANKQSSQIMREFTVSMEKIQDEFKKNKKEEFRSRYQIAEEKIKRDENRKISEAIMDQRRRLSLYQQEKKEKLFQVVRDMLKEYRRTEEYDEYLISKICKAKEFARQEEIIIFLGCKDVEKKEYLEQKTGCVLTMSDKDFGGGIRAEVRARNILIDESFETKLNQEQDAYTI